MVRFLLAACLAAMCVLSGTDKAGAQSTPAPAEPTMSASPLPAAGPPSNPVAIPSPPVGPGASPGPLEASNSSTYHVQFTNTLKYSVGLRTSAVNPALISNINQDDANRNFGNNAVPFNRFDLLSELDAQNKYFGVRVSGEGWYDTAYQGNNVNNSPFTVNQFSTQFNEFVPPTRNIMGEYSRLLDAFAFGNFSLGQTKVTLRAGQHASLWGETLFYGTNGIAGAMAPVDLTKLLQEPSLQFKEFILPTPQLSTDIALTPELSLGAYYQLHYSTNLFPPVGSYFGSVDVFDQGAERLFVGGPLYHGGPLAALAAGSDLLPANQSAQGGLEVHYAPQGSGFDLGFYALQFDEKAPGSIVLDFGPGANSFPGAIGNFYYAFPRGVHAYGVSLSKSIGDFNIGFESSVRTNTDLNSKGVTCGALPGLPHGFLLPCGDNWRDPKYPVGSAWYANGNVLWSLPPNSIARESNLAFEVAYNDLLGVGANPSALNPLATRAAAAARLSFTPTYRQALHGVDLSVPISVGMGLAGFTSALQAGSFPAGGVGDYEAGFNAVVADRTNITLGYTGYFGPVGNFLNPAAVPSGQQYYADRGFLSFSIGRSF